MLSESLQLPVKMLVSPVCNISNLLTATHYITYFLDFLSPVSEMQTMSSWQYCNVSWLYFVQSLLTIAYEVKFWLFCWLFPKYACGRLPQITSKPFLSSAPNFSLSHQCIIIRQKEDGNKETYQSRDIIFLFLTIGLYIMGVVLALWLVQ